MKATNHHGMPVESDKKRIQTMPMPVQRAIQKLGTDLALARRRRRISQTSLALRIGGSVSTIKRIESGDLRVPLHFYARVLYVFGEIDRLVTLIDTATDEVGLSMMDAELPQRIREPRRIAGLSAM